METVEESAVRMWHGGVIEEEEKMMDKLLRHESVAECLFIIEGMTVSNKFVFEPLTVRSPELSRVAWELWSIEEEGTEEVCLSSKVGGVFLGTFSKLQFNL